MNDLGKYIFIAGLVIAVVGLILWSGVGRGWLGQLPGDINVKGDGYSFHFPIVACVIISVGLSLFFWLYRR